MNILDLDKNIVMAFAPLVHGNLPMWIEVCKAVRDGKTQEKIAEMFNTDDRTVRWIIKEKCLKCSK